MENTQVQSHVTLENFLYSFFEEHPESCYNDFYLYNQVKNRFNITKHQYYKTIQLLLEKELIEQCSMYEVLGTNEILYRLNN